MATWIKTQPGKSPIITRLGPCFKMAPKLEMCFAPRTKRCWVQNTSRIQHKDVLKSIFIYRRLEA